MATIDENGNIRDGRDRKVNGTITKLKSGRFVFNCRICAEDFKHSEEIIDHIDSVHSKKRDDDIVKTEPNSIIQENNPIASTSTYYLMATHSDKNLSDQVLENTSALSETTQSTSNENKKRKGYTPFMDALNEPNPISRYNSKVRLDMIIFDSSKVKKEQHCITRFSPYNKPNQKRTIDRTKLADAISRLNIVNRRKESVELVANELRLRLTNSTDRLWLANKMKSSIDKMNQHLHKIKCTKKTSLKKEPTDNFNGFSENDIKNAVLKYTNEFQPRSRLCRNKTEIDPTEVMHRYGISNYRKETVDFVAGKLNIILQTFYERERLRTKMRTIIISQKKFLLKSKVSSASSDN